MIFKPQIWINSVLDIDEDFLDKYNIKALVLDLDNTLSMHGNPAAENGIPEWLQHMKNIGVPMRIVSNNTNKRVAPLAKKLGLPFTANGCKPLTFGISKAIKIMGVPKKQVAVVGDQIFTDVIAGNIKVLCRCLLSLSIWKVRGRSSLKEKRRVCFSTGTTRSWKPRRKSNGC